MIEIDASELVGWADAVALVPDRLHQEMTTTTNVVLMEMTTKAKELAPVGDGPLRADIRILAAARGSMGGDYTGRVGTNLVYSAQREYGGTIYPRNSEFLVFEWDLAKTADNPRGLVFARSVTQEGSFYMRGAEEWMQGEISGYYQLAVDRSLEGVFG